VKMKEQTRLTLLLFVSIDYPSTGQSSGAQFVTALLGSPKAKGLFHRAIVMSTRPADAANALITQQNAFETSGKATVESLGCGNLSESQTTSCLKALDVDKFLESKVFNKLVVDQDFITQKSLAVTKSRISNGETVNQVPVIWGFMRDEMASLGSVPQISISNLTEALKSAGIDDVSTQIVVANPQTFPVPQLPNGIQNVSVTVETLIKSIAKCGQISTLNSIVKNQIFGQGKIWSYTFDERSWQIDNFVGTSCMGRDGTADDLYHCHSGDLMPLFASMG